MGQYHPTHHNDWPESQSFVNLSKIRTLHVHTGSSLQPRLDIQNLWPVDLSELTVSECQALGFIPWDEEDGQIPLYLIPQWIVPFIPEQIRVFSCNSGKVILDRSEMTDDPNGWFEVIPYGIHPRDG